MFIYRIQNLWNFSEKKKKKLKNFSSLDAEWEFQGVFNRGKEKTFCGVLSCWVDGGNVKISMIFPVWESNERQKKDAWEKQ